MKILLFGKNGQVGWELHRSLLPLGELIAVGRAEADFSAPETLRSFVQAVKPQIIANAVAYTAVDKAEEEESLAYRINADSPTVLADEAKRLNALLVHYSTDYVFDGTKSTPYTEDDEPNPLNAYGRTKLAGDRAIQVSGCRHLIFRTSWVYGARGQNFMLTMLRLAKDRSELKVVADQFGAPTWSRLVAETTAAVLAKTANVFPVERSGLYNLTTAGSTSWHGFAQAIIDGAKRRALLSADKNVIVKRIPTSLYAMKASRPLNSVLSSSKVFSSFGIQMPSWDSCLEKLLDEMTLGLQ
ncbi:MAG: rfbD1 [Nitrospirae bacterium]|nr:MAG: rfbD1 [Nitrospirota bacterium]